MMTTGLDIVQAICDVAAENPDKVYEDPSGRCVNVRDGEPSCIVGCALWKLGIIDADFESDHLNPADATSVMDAFQVGYSSSENSWITYTQGLQDSGELTWSECVSRANESVAL